MFLSWASQRQMSLRQFVLPGCTRGLTTIDR